MTIALNTTSPIPRAVQPVLISLSDPPRRDGSCEARQLADLLQLMGASPREVQAGAAMPVAIRRLRTGQALFGEGCQAEAFYFVRGGTFKSFTTGADGYEQVMGFATRGEALGFDAIGLGRYTNEAQALEDSSVFTVLLRDYLAAGPRNAALDRVVFRAVSNALLRRGELADVMAAVAAEVRLSRFLLHLSCQMRDCGQSARRFHLRMSRRDIASYLGVAHETISRSFGTLVAQRLVWVENREVEILDMERLRVFASGTRRAMDDTGRPGAPRTGGAQHTRHVLAPSRGAVCTAELVH